jgi:hypothetical protein
VASSGAKAADEVVVITTGANGDTVFRSVFPDQSNAYTDITGNLAKPVYGIGVRSANPKFYYLATDQGAFRSPDFVPVAPQLFWTTSGGHPKLYWRAGGDADIKHFRIYRSSHPYGDGSSCSFPGMLLATTSDTTYTDNTVQVFVKGPGNPTPERVYCYTVLAVDSTNNESPYSNTVQVNADEGGLGQEKTVHRGGDEIVPERFSLESNYPNPFNPVTTIRYALPEDVHVTLKVYDVLGREVATLVNKFEKAGYKEVSFDASALPSGVYLYRITAGTFTQARRMVFVK